MGASLTYMRLEIKRACMVLPHFLAGAIVLALLLGTIAFSASKVLYGEAVTGRITVGVALPEEDVVADKAVSMISSLESVKSLCDFQYMEEAEGRRALKAGDIYALMVIPAGFVRDIMNGTNTPVTLLFPENPGQEAGIFKELADAGARTLSVAQAAIYAGDEFLRNQSMAASIPEIEQKLNQLYMRYALPREEYFREYKVSAAGDISVTAYYGAALSVLFLLLCGIPASMILRPDSLVFQRKLKGIGIGRFQVIGVKIAAASILVGMAAFLILGVSVLTGAVPFQWGMIPAAVVLCVACSCMIVFAYEAAGSPTAGVMLLFLAVTGMVFLSGGFVPPVFLPEGIRQLGDFMPTSLLIGAVKGFVIGNISWPAVGNTLAMGAVFYAAAVWIRRIHEKD